MGRRTAGTGDAPLLAPRGHHQGLSRRRRERRASASTCGRRDPRRRRRERGRQDHAHGRRLRPPSPRRRARARRRREVHARRSRATRSPPGIGYVQQHFSLIPTLTVAENLVLAAARRPVPARRPDAARSVSATCRAEYRARGRSGRARRAPERRRAAASRAVEGARSRDAGPDPRRAAPLLTPQESDELSAILRRLAASRDRHLPHRPQARRGAGGSPTASRVLRRGRLVATLPRADVDREPPRAR